MEKSLVKYAYKLDMQIFHFKSLPIRKKKKKGVKQILSGTLNRSLRRVRTKLQQSSTIKRGRRPNRNYVKRTYFSRFILRPKRKYKRTNKRVPGIPFLYKHKNATFRGKEIARRAIKLKNPRIKKKIEHKIKKKPIKHFTYGLLTMRHAKRNFFISVHKFLDKTMKGDPYIKLINGKESF